MCHGWASGPTSWLSRHILGVEVIEPGCRQVRITPHLGRFTVGERYISNSYGELQIYHEKQANGNVISEVKAPKGVSVIK